MKIYCGKSKLTLCKTCSRNIGVLNKVKHFLPNSAMYQLYCTLVLPYLNYGLLLWGNVNKFYMNKIFRLQKRALRTISNSSYYVQLNLCLRNTKYWIYLICTQKKLLCLCTNINAICFHALLTDILPPIKKFTGTTQGIKVISISLNVTANLIRCL